MAITATTPGAGTGFKEVGNAQAPQRLIMDLHGMEREGKSTMALSAPGPIALMQLDPGCEDIIPKIRKQYPKKRLFVAKYYVDMKPNMTVSEVEALATPMWQKFTKDYEAALTQFRTVIVDTHTEAWELLRLAEFGKVAQIKPIHYGPVNAEFRRLLRLPYNHSCNVIFVHKMKRTYKDDKWNGNMERAGFSTLGYEVQIEARAFWDEEGGFQTEVLNCRQNCSLRGMIVPEPMNDFANLAMLVYPESAAKDWQ